MKKIQISKSRKSKGGLCCRFFFYRILLLVVVGHPKKNGIQKRPAVPGLWAFLDPSVLPGMEITTLLGGTVAAAGLGLVVTSQVPGMFWGCFSKGSVGKGDVFFWGGSRFLCFCFKGSVGKGEGFFWGGAGFYVFVCKGSVGKGEGFFLG